MYCIYCGKCIADDSLFCPYCGKNQEIRTFYYCHNCGKIIDKDSIFCTYCGCKQYNRSQWQIRCITLWRSVKSNGSYLVKNRFFIWYVLWCFVNSLLLYKSSNSYTDYFNKINVSPDYWSSSDKGIFPKDWFYPFSNIFNGIKGQDPVYVYDISEFYVYVFILPFIFTLIIYRKGRMFKTQKAANVLYQIIWHIVLWLLVVLSMGIIGLDILVWSFVVGGLITAICAYLKIKSQYF